MPSSLKPSSATLPGLAEPPATDWRALPGQEPETVLKTPRGEAAEAQPASSEMPSMWRRLFPPPGETSSDSSFGFEPAQGVPLGHFTIERRIGAGAMGAVFLAFDDRLRRQVALKVLSPAQATDPSSVQRFQNEAQAAARLDHDHIARVFYYGEEGGLHFIAYEFVAGINLRDLLRQRGRLTAAEAVNYAIQVATALRHTVRHGVVHRDIKPSNIIVTATGRAKLVDLGLAKRDGTEPGGDLTVAGTTLGTFDYISPEQARDPRTVDIRSDLYSLGCTLYHVLTGEPPYPAGTVLQKLLDHQAHDTPDVLLKNRHVPPALAAVVRKLMASDPRRRYATPDELLRDLAVIARSLGLRVVSTDSTTLLPEARLRGSWWDRNFGWVFTAAALLVIVTTLHSAPRLLERFTAWSGQLPESASMPGRNASPPSAEHSQPAQDAAADAESTNALKNSASPIVPAPSETIAKTPRKNVDETANPTPVVSEPPEKKLANKKSELEEQAELPTPTAVSDKQPAKPVSAVDPDPVPTIVPAISIIGSENEFATLEEACAEAKDGQIIELSVNGPVAVSEYIRLTSKRLTIRAARGFRPLLEFADNGRGEPSATRLIVVSGGSLQLVNLDLAARISSSPSGGGWTLFSLERPEQLQLDGVTITIANPRRRQASVIEFGSPASLAAGLMKTGQPAAPPEIRLSDCVIRGAAALITIREMTSARFAVQDSLIALDDSLLQVTGRPAMNMKDGSQIKLELLHTTAILGGSLIICRPEENFSDRQIPLLVTAKNNLISVGRDHPMVDLSGAGDAMELRDSFVWSGERNGYDDVAAFWVIRSRQNVNPLDFAAWKELWGGEATGSWNEPIRWKQPVRQLTLQTVTPNHAALEENANLNPAIKGAADGSDLGAPLEQLPVPPELDAPR